ncbi:MAG: hypothetical protein ACK4OM_03265 [Alphaproteobacteria bacterium]
MSQNNIDSSNQVLEIKNNDYFTKENVGYVLDIGSTLLQNMIEQIAKFLQIGTAQAVNQIFESSPNEALTYPLKAILTNAINGMIEKLSKLLRDDIEELEHEGTDYIVENVPLVEQSLILMVSNVKAEVKESLSFNDVILANNEIELSGEMNSAS